MSVKLRPAYSQDSLARAQALFRLDFPPDLLDFLTAPHPAGGVDWTDVSAVRERLAWPYEGLLFDVENGGLWWPEWGERPAGAAERAEALAAIVAKAPRLIPLYGHRYLPQTPARAGNPVFSVYQSDVIYYGANLADYVGREFHPPPSDRPRPWPDRIREIPFWSEMVRRNGEGDEETRERLAAEIIAHRGKW